MATHYGVTATPSEVTSGLIHDFDAGNASSYPGTGVTWTDVVGAQTMTLYGSPTWNPSGYFAFSDNQITEYAMDTSFPFPTGDHTVGSWFNSRFTSATQCPYSYSIAGDNHFLMFIKSSSQLAPHSFATTYDINVPNMANNWIQFVRTRVQSTGVENYYMNGNKVASRTNGIGTAATTNGYLIIAQEPDTPGGGFSPEQNLDGDFARLTIYNRSLSDKEVARNFQANRSRFGI